MTWICPECNRTFKNKNQDHSCVIKSIDDHFLNKPQIIKHVYDVLIHRIQDFGKMKIVAVVNAIICSSKSTFLVIKPKKNWIDIEFLLNEPIEEFPIHKTVKASNKRFAHFIRIGIPDEIDDQLISWLKRSYEIITD